MCARKLLSHSTGSLARPPCACFITFPLHCLCLQAVATANASLFVYDTIFTNVHTMHTTGGHNNGTNTYYPMPAICGTPLPGRHLLLSGFLVLPVDRFRLSSGNGIALYAIWFGPFRFTGCAVSASHCEVILHSMCVCLCDPRLTPLPTHPPCQTSSPTTAWW